MQIETFSRTDYGNTRTYVKDEQIALAVTMLTGRKTLSASDIKAFGFLGMEFVEGGYGN